MGILHRLGTYLPMFGALDRYLDERKFRARIRSTPASRIGDLAEGVRGRITGRVVALGEPITAPLSGLPCVYWRVEIDDHGDGGVRDVLADIDDCVSFLVVDNALERAVIDATYANVRGNSTHTQTSLAAFDATPAQRALLQRENLIHRNWFQTTYLGYRESIITVGAVITVVGEGVREADPEAEAPGDYRSSVRTRLRISGTRQRPIDIDAERD